MSRAGLGRTRAGWRALRAERVSRASMLALRMRTSRSERPGEERRRCWNSSWLVAGRDSTRTLRTPSCSMKRRDSSRAPEPMASMPMTLPTPRSALLEFLLAGGGAGFDEDVADAELLDEAEGFLAGAGADGEHADDAADAEDDAEGGEQGAGLLGAEVGAGLADVGEEDHRGAPGGEK